MGCLMANVFALSHDRSRIPIGIAVLGLQEDHSPPPPAAIPATRSRLRGPRADRYSGRDDRRGGEESRGAGGGGDPLSLCRRLTPKNQKASWP
ncbi:uncharacterized protein N7515_008835 [Penicillium bovifimosum]|uniref:Uncharacterized protein n=1 Tax=Penicillium bovifimosum TaxID=126998 RepID=A0A9W9GQ88_9EURO|nr:uncharacterized protein N7515_008835 [Penicillium bovifimosum]KAJ5125010.1 hypothetical protein N7515_008835 [Penicillium bovifimosum]